MPCTKNGAAQLIESYFLDDHDGEGQGRAKAAASSSFASSADTRSRIELARTP
nr:hypothetical protein [Agrobacterium vitis]